MLTPREAAQRKRDLIQELDICLVRMQESFEQVSKVSETVDDLTMRHGPVESLRASSFLLDEVSYSISLSLNSLSKRLNVLKYFPCKPIHQQETT